MPIRENKRHRSAPGTGWPMPLILHFGGSVATHADKIGFPKGTPLAHDFACKV